MPSAGGSLLPTTASPMLGKQQSSGLPPSSLQSVDPLAKPQSSDVAQTNSGGLLANASGPGGEALGSAMSIDTTTFPGSGSQEGSQGRKRQGCSPSAWLVAKCSALVRRPWWLVVALLVFCAAVGFGVWGVIAAAKSEYNTRQATAVTSANEKALNVRTVIVGAFNPCITVAMLIRQQPFNWTALNDTFYQVAGDIFNLTNQDSIQNIQLVPNSIIESIIPITGFTKAVNLDLLREPDRRPDSLKAIQADAITMAGPNMLAVGISGLVGRYPVFVPDVDMNETFGFGPSMELAQGDGVPAWMDPPACCNTNCSSVPPLLQATTPCCSADFGCGNCTNGIAPVFARWSACSPLDPAPGMGIFHPDYGNCSVDLCYRAETRSKFWGFTEVALQWEKAKETAQLYDLCSQFDFIMTYTDVYGNPDVPIAMCADVRMIPTASPGIWNGTLGPYTLADYLPRDPISVTIAVDNNEWTLWVVDSRGWIPSWKAPLIAAVVLIALLFAFLTLLLIASHLQQEQLLEEQRASNRKLAHTKAVLEAEKATTDALIMRQLNLISCFATADEATQPKGAKGLPRPSMEQQTLSRIEAVRRQLNNGQRENDQVQVLDMLGEGSFGKVYKGLWRGSEVAVKTIVLPANMSGAAKREKMAIMEAAISTSMIHPNIVQTYTYSIRPLRDTVPCPEGDVPVNSGLIHLKSQTNTWQEMGAQQAPAGLMRGSTREGEGAIISYEVRLVLEYCDQGCLRDALDAGVFFSPKGLNYRAILDTCIDIAKAMLHLHLANVLHSDLKARNIMLKRSGQEGRGTCAKVADFGLSVSLDQTQTHMSSMFQGTLTHMAPEVLMKGHVSKAADIYAFGITMWEVLTGGAAFKEVPGPHLGHAITVLKKRPEFTLAAPRAFRALAEACWADDPDTRPPFQEVLAQLQRMRSELPGPTDPLDPAAFVPKPRAKDSKPERPSPSFSRVGGLVATPASLGSTLVDESGALNEEGSAVAGNGGGDAPGSSGGGSRGGIIIGGSSGARSLGGSLGGSLGSAMVVVGVGMHASMHTSLRRSLLADVPEGCECSEEDNKQSSSREGGTTASPGGSQAVPTPPSRYSMEEL